jgi:tRNA pseudouridine38-40 synthase
MDEDTVDTLSSSENPSLKRSAEDLQGPEDAKRPKLACAESTSLIASPDSKKEKHDKTDVSRDQKFRKGKNKSEKNKGRRRGSRPDEELAQDETRQKTPRLPKKQCALLIGFCGTGCAGMQM